MRDMLESAEKKFVLEFVERNRQALPEAAGRPECGRNGKISPVDGGALRARTTEFPNLEIAKRRGYASS